jgi:hypothetical protein
MVPMHWAKIYMLKKMSWAEIIPLCFKEQSGNTIIFTTTDGAKVTAISGKDSGIFHSATTTKTFNGQC